MDGNGAAYSHSNSNSNSNSNTNSNGNGNDIYVKSSSDSNCNCDCDSNSNSNRNRNSHWISNSTTFHRTGNLKTQRSMTLAYGLRGRVSDERVVAYATNNLSCFTGVWICGLVGCYVESL